MPRKVNIPKDEDHPEEEAVNVRTGSPTIGEYPKSWDMFEQLENTPLSYESTRVILPSIKK